MKIKDLYDIYDDLDILELKSLFKSNKFSKEEKSINNFYLSNRTIKDLISIIAIFGLTTAIIDKIISK